MLKHGLEHAQCLSGSMSNKGIPRNLTLHQSWKETTTGPWPKPFRLILFVYSHLNIILLYNHASTNRILFVFHKNFLISFFYSIRDMCAYIYIPLCNSSYAHTKTPSEKCKLWSFSLHNFLFSSFSLNDIPEHVVLKRPEVFIFRDRKYSKWYWHFHCTVN